MNRNRINGTCTRCTPYVIHLMVHLSCKSGKRVRKCSKGKHPFPFERCPELTPEPMPLNTCYVKSTIVIRSFTPITQHYKKQTLQQQLKKKIK